MPPTAICCIPFLSPLTNRRNDAYGGDLAGGRVAFSRSRWRAPCAKPWPAHLPLFTRLSCVDGIEGGLEIADTIWLAQQLKAIGIDVIDCSSGGLCGFRHRRAVRRGPGFQVPFAEAVRREAEIPTMAVGADPRGGPGRGDPRSRPGGYHRHRREGPGPPSIPTGRFHGARRNSTPMAPESFRALARAIRLVAGAAAAGHGSRARSNALSFFSSPD